MCVGVRGCCQEYMISFDNLCGSLENISYMSLSPVNLPPTCLSTIVCSKEHPAQCQVSEAVRLFLFKAASYKTNIMQEAFQELEKNIKFSCSLDPTILTQRGGFMFCRECEVTPVHEHALH